MSMTQPPKQKFLDELKAHLKAHLGFEHVSMAGDLASLTHTVTGVTKEGIAVNHSFTDYQLEAGDLGNLIPAICDSMKQELMVATVNHPAYWHPLGGALQPPPDQQAKEKYCEAKFDLAMAKAAMLEKKLKMEQYQMWSNTPAADLKKQLAEVLKKDMLQGAGMGGSYIGPPAPPSGPAPKTMYELYGVSKDADKS